MGDQKAEMVTLGSRIRQWREAVNWTQRDLAERAGITQAAIHLYESDQRTPSLKVIRKIAEAFGKQADDLLRSTDALDTSKPPIELWEALHWPKDLVEETIEDWPDYSEAERLEIVKAAYDVYERQQALERKIRQRRPAV